MEWKKVKQNKEEIKGVADCSAGHYPMLPVREGSSASCWNSRKRNVQQTLQSLSEKFYNLSQDRDMLLLLLVTSPVLFCF